MYWNHRVIRTEDDGEPFYAVHECHYNDGETIPHSWTSEPADVCSETRDGLSWALSGVAKGIALPVLEVGADGKLHELEPATEAADTLREAVNGKPSAAAEIDEPGAADVYLAHFDAMADHWSNEVNLTALIKMTVAPMDLTRRAPDDVRAEFKHRMEVQIDAIARQCFLEGANRMIDTMLDERKWSDGAIDKTIAFIKAAHAGQVDKAGAPYWLHPVAVMHRLGSGATVMEKLTALLHDTVEDTKYSIDDLRGSGIFDPVLMAVALLTRPKDADRLPYLDWIREIAASGNRIAIKVKIADNEENADPDRLALLPADEAASLAERYAASLAILRPALEAIRPCLT